MVSVILCFFGIPYKPAWSSKRSLGLKNASRFTSWGTIPIEDLTCLGFLSKSLPHTLTIPEFLITVPARIFKKVVFPAPFGPSSPKISPRFTSKFKLFSAITSVEFFFV